MLEISAASVPALIVAAPVKEFAPESVSMPVPILTRLPPVPEIMPA